MQQQRPRGCQKHHPTPRTTASFKRMKRAHTQVGALGAVCNLKRKPPQHTPPPRATSTHPPRRHPTYMLSNTLLTCACLRALHSHSCTTGGGDQGEGGSGGGQAATAWRPIQRAPAKATPTPSRPQARPAPTTHAPTAASGARASSRQQRRSRYEGLMYVCQRGGLSVDAGIMAGMLHVILHGVDFNLSQSGSTFCRTAE
jgi:hypothetical protein